LVKELLKKTPNEKRPRLLASDSAARECSASVSKPQNWGQIPLVNGAANALPSLEQFFNDPLALTDRVRTQPQRGVGGLHRFPYHPHQFFV
jgi:hypothetical protein